MYIKSQGGATVQYHGPSIGRTAMTAAGWLWYDGAEPVDQISINADGTVTVAPQVADTRDWRDIEDVINASYQLIDATAIAGVVADANALKAAVAGLALLTSNAAPGGMIDINDPRVEQWLAMAGVGLDQLRSQIDGPAAGEVMQ